MANKCQLNNVTLLNLSVHKISLPGMKVFTCSISTCSFTTGSQVLFRRHIDTHSKLKVPLKYLPDFRLNTKTGKIN